jgi:hypothetical protein
MHLAGNLAAVLSGHPPRPFIYANKGAIVGLGCRTGVARIGRLKISGFAAWFVFRTVYLMKMPGWARRARVALDWTMDLLFPRDYVELGILRSRLDNRNQPQGKSGGGAAQDELTRERSGDQAAQAAGSSSPAASTPPGR